MARQALRGSPLMCNVGRHSCLVGGRTCVELGHRKTLLKASLILWFCLRSFTRGRLIRGTSVEVLAREASPLYGHDYEIEEFFPCCCVCLCFIFLADSTLTHHPCWEAAPKEKTWLHQVPERKAPGLCRDRKCAPTDVRSSCLHVVTSLYFALYRFPLVLHREDLGSLVGSVVRPHTSCFAKKSGTGIQF